MSSNLQLTKERLFCTSNVSEKYRVHLLFGPWPTEDEIINFCNGGPGHFGGEVSLTNSNESEVTVYID